MSKNKKTFKVDGKEYSVVAPNAKVNQAAQRVYSAEFTKCIQDGLMVRDTLKQFLEDHGVWSKAMDEEAEEKTKEINKLELELYQPDNSRKKKISLKEGKDKALKIKKLREEHMDFIRKKQEYEANTAESIAENIRFDYLVSQCTLNKDGSKVYNSFEEYQEKDTDDLAFQAAQALAKMMYALDDDYAQKLPENHFLSTFGLLDEEGRLVNEDGHLVDKENRLINEEGWYLDEKGNRVDRDGHPLTEDGFFKLGAIYTDEDGKAVKLSEDEKPKKEIADSKQLETDTEEVSG